MGIHAPIHNLIKHTEISMSSLDALPANSHSLPYVLIVDVLTLIYEINGDRSNSGQSLFGSSMALAVQVANYMMENIPLAAFNVIFLTTEGAGHRKKLRPYNNRIQDIVINKKLADHNVQVAKNLRTCLLSHPQRSVSQECKVHVISARSEADVQIASIIELYYLRRENLLVPGLIDVNAVRSSPAQLITESQHFQQDTCVPESKKTIKNSFFTTPMIDTVSTRHKSIVFVSSTQNNHPAVRNIKKQCKEETTNSGALLPLLSKFQFTPPASLKHNKNSNDGNSNTNSNTGSNERNNTGSNCCFDKLIRIKCSVPTKCNLHTKSNVPVECNVPTKKIKFGTKSTATSIGSTATGTLNTSIGSTGTPAITARLVIWTTDSDILITAGGFSCAHMRINWMRNKSLYDISSFNIDVALMLILLGCDRISRICNGHSLTYDYVQNIISCKNPEISITTTPKLKRSSCVPSRNEIISKLKKWKVDDSHASDIRKVLKYYIHGNSILVQ